MNETLKEFNLNNPGPDRYWDNPGLQKQKRKGSSTPPQKRVLAA